MKKLLFCIAFLTVSSKSSSAGLLDSMKVATSCVNVLSASTDDVIAETIKLPFSTDSVGITLVVGLNGVGAAAMIDNNVYMFGIPMRTLVAAFIVTGGLYIAYRVGSWKEKKKSEEE